MRCLPTSKLPTPSAFDEVKFSQTEHQFSQIDHRFDRPVYRLDSVTKQVGSRQDARRPVQSSLTGENSQHQASQLVDWLSLRISRLFPRGEVFQRVLFRIIQ